MLSLLLRGGKKSNIVYNIYFFVYLFLEEVLPRSRFDLLILAHIVPFCFFVFLNLLKIDIFKSCISLIIKRNVFRTGF